MADTDKVWLTAATATQAAIHLRTGGTRLEASLVADRIAGESNVPPDARGAVEWVSITPATGSAIVRHLRESGSYLQADLLADRLLDEGNAPQREAAMQAQIDAAVQVGLQAKTSATHSAPKRRTARSR